ncbi:MAG: hypothetical protein ACRC20_03000 [Segniliparus sp.]|uniref:hypothetical protein n=1 Tax=Segniliparus sp. TaxID=2804064 RepID=UPI003F2EEED5
MSADDPIRGFSASLAAARRAAQEARAQAEFVLRDIAAAQGLDDREVVTVTIDAGCHITDVSFAPRWRVVRESEELDDVISQGHEAAREAQDAALARLVYEAMTRGEQPEPSPLPWGSDEMFGPPTRTLASLVGDFLDHQARDAGGSEFGKNEAATVTVEANQRGFVSCGVDPRWADDCENWEITGGLVEASDNARELVEQEAAKPDTALDIAYDAVRIIWQCE